MRSWIGACLFLVAMPASAQPAAGDDPLMGLALGMDKPALARAAAASGAVLDCQSLETMVNAKRMPVQRCVVDHAAAKIDVLLAQNPQGLRVAAFVIERASQEAETTLQQIVQRWGEPAQADHWQMGARVLVLNRDCQGGEAVCLEYSDNAWARQAARGAGIGMAYP